MLTLPASCWYAVGIESSWCPRAEAYEVNTRKLVSRKPIPAQTTPKYATPVVDCILKPWVLIISVSPRTCFDECTKRNRNAMTLIAVCRLTGEGRRRYVLSNMYVMRGIMLLTTHVLQHGGCPEWVTKREITRTSGSFLYVLRFPMVNWQLNACVLYTERRTIVPQMFLFFKFLSSIFFRFHLIFCEWWRKKNLVKIQFEIWRHYCVFLSTLHYGKSTILFCVFIK